MSEIVPQPAPTVAPESLHDGNRGAIPVEPVQGTGGLPPTATPGPTHSLIVPKTRTSYAWVGVTIGLIVLLLMIIFVWQNRHSARLSFLWLHGNVPVGLTMLLAFVLGGLVVGLIGTARLTQLRLMARRHRDQGPPPAA